MSPYDAVGAASSSSAATGSSPLLRVAGLCRSFGERRAVDQLSLEVHEGEVVGLLGPNGAGKSTTFSILSGLLRPDQGQVFFRGRLLSLHDPSLRAQMGIVFQRNSLDDQLTAHENLLLGARLYAVPSAQARVRAEQLLDLIGLSERAHERVKGWSGGMRRRLELARALIHQPPILLMDEPTQGLDEAAFRSFWAHLASLRTERPLTVLITTHRPDEAALCDRLAVLSQGRVAACHTPSELIAQVGGDVVTIEAPNPSEVVAALREKLGVNPHLVEGRIQIEVEQGHRLVPRVVETFPAGRLTAVGLRRPTLADVFQKLTGHSLGGEG